MHYLGGEHVICTTQKTKIPTLIVFFLFLQHLVTRIDDVGEFFCVIIPLLVSPPLDDKGPGVGDLAVLNPVELVGQAQLEGARLECLLGNL